MQGSPGPTGLKGERGIPGEPGALEALAHKLSNGHGAGLTFPVPTTTRLELASRERASFGLWELSLGRGRCEQQGLSVFREGWLLSYGTVSVQRECKKRFQALRDICTGGVHTAGDMTVHVLEEVKIAGQCVQNSHSNSFVIPGPVGAIGPQDLPVPWVPQD